jgi:hypothetical protein
MATATAKKPRKPRPCAGAKESVKKNWRAPGPVGDSLSTAQAPTRHIGVLSAVSQSASNGHLMRGHDDERGHNDDGSDSTLDGHDVSLAVAARDRGDSHDD